MVDKTELITRKNTLPQPVKKDGLMTIALETFHASAGEDNEILGRTYLRLREIGTFTSDTPYPIISDKLKEAMKEETLREQKTLEFIERSHEYRGKIIRV